MRSLDRRTLLGSLTVLAGTLAGCTGDNDDTNVSDRIAGAVSDGVVDYEGLTDGAVSVGEGSQELTYEDPEWRFLGYPIYEGQRATDDQLRFAPDLSGDMPAVFVAPTHDETFTYHVFVNGAFRDFADWHVAKRDLGGDMEKLRMASFEGVTDDVWYASVAPEGDGEGIAIVDAPPAKINSREAESPSGIVMAGRPVPDQPQAPVVSFDFDREGDTLTITHRSGEAVSANTLVVDVDGERIEGAFGEGEVTSGDRATIDLVEYPDDVEVRVIWEVEGTSQTLDATTVA